MKTESLSDSSTPSTPQPMQPAQPHKPHRTTTPRRRTRNGKVARLPKHVRDTINGALRDGIPYRTIIGVLGHHGHHLNEDNITSWKRGGYQDWLKQQDFLDQLRAKQDFALDFLKQ